MQRCHCKMWIWNLYFIKTWNWNSKLLLHLSISPIVLQLCVIYVFILFMALPRCGVILNPNLNNISSLSSQVSLRLWSSENNKDLYNYVRAWLMTCRCWCVICCFKWLQRCVSSADWPIVDSFWLLKDLRQISLCGSTFLLFFSMIAQLLSCGVD